MSLAVFTTALAARVAHVLLVSDTAYFGLYLGDAAAFHQQALAIADGAWLGTGVLFHAPGYPYFLGAVYAVLGADPLTVRLLQALVGALSATFIAQAAGRLFSPRVALAAGLVGALYGPAVFYDTIVQDSVVDLFFGSLAVWALAEAILRRTPGRLFLLGLSVGAFSLSREYALILLPLAAFWAAWSRSDAGPGRGRERVEPGPVREGVGPARRRERLGPALGRAGTVLVGAALVLAPLVARNLAVGEGPLPGRQIQLGVNLFIGNGAGADGLYRSVRTGRGDPIFEYQDAIAVGEQAAGRELSAPEASGYWIRRTASDVAGAPLHWVRLMARKALLALSHKEFADTEGPDLYATDSVLLRILLYFHFGVLLALGVLGVARAWPRRRQLWVLFAWPVAYLLGVVAFFVFGRYRHPAFPALAVLAGAGIVHGLALVRDRRLPSAPVGVAALAVLGLSLLPLGPSSTAMAAHGLVNVGVGLENRGDGTAAARHYAEALRTDPGSVQAAYRLADLLRRAGRLEEALPLFEAALRRDPDNPTILNDYGIALAHSGRSDEARHQFERTLEVDPLYTQARVNIAQLDLARSDTAGALAQLHAAVEDAPEDAVAWYVLIDLALAGDTRAVLAPVLGPAAGASQRRYRGFIQGLGTYRQARPDPDLRARLTELLEAWAGPLRDTPEYRAVMDRLQAIR